MFIVEAQHQFGPLNPPIRVDRVDFGVFVGVWGCWVNIPIGQSKNGAMGRVELNLGDIHACRYGGNGLYALPMHRANQTP